MFKRLALRLVGLEGFFDGKKTYLGLALAALALTIPGLDTVGIEQEIKAAAFDAQPWLLVGGQITTAYGLAHKVYKKFIKKK